MDNYDYQLNCLISYYESLISFADPLSKFNIVKSESDIVETHQMLINIRQYIIDKKFTEAAKELMTRYKELPYHLAHVRDILEFYNSNTNATYNIENQQLNLPISSEYNSSELNGKEFINELVIQTEKLKLISDRFSLLNIDTNQLELILEKLSSLNINTDQISDSLIDATLNKISTINKATNIEFSESNNYNESLSNLKTMIESLISLYEKQIKDISESVLNHNQIVTLAFSEVSKQIEINQRKLLTELLTHETKEFTAEAKNFINHYNNRFNAIEQYANKVIKEVQSIAQNSILNDKVELFKQAKDTINSEFNSAVKQLFKIAAITTVACTIIISSTTAYVTAKYTKQNFISTLQELSNNIKDKK